MAFDRLSTALEIAAAHDLTGRLAVVTGAASGIGVDTARGLVHAGATVVMGVRDLAKGGSVADQIGRETGRPPEVLPLDLAEPRSVHAFAEAVIARHPSLDFLVANAGVSKTPEAHLASGLDVRFATNHLGHFLLANLLLDPLTAGGARIAVVSSAAHKGRPIVFDDLQWQRRDRNDLTAYGESKTANILFAVEASWRWAARGICANAVLPGSIMTGLQRYHGEALKRRIGLILPDGTPNSRLKTAAQGAATTLWACCAPELAGRGGLVLEDCAIALPAGSDSHPWTGYDPEVIDLADARRLWDLSVQMADLG